MAFQSVFSAKRIVLSLLLTPFVASAAPELSTPKAASKNKGFKGSLSFSDEEITQHAKNLPKIMATASGCLERQLDRHKKFHAKLGISPFYGSLSSFAKLSIAEKKQQLVSLGLPASLVKELEPTSCIGLTLQCLGEGFAAVQMNATWKKLSDFANANDQDGTSLQHGLQKLGWRILFWNPYVSYSQFWDSREKANDPTNHDHFWGYHEMRWISVTSSKHNYYYNNVDDWSTLVNFNTDVPKVFKKIPFFVGTAHTGYHVFPGMFGQVIEGHSMRQITDSQTIESSPFNPIQDGGGPRGNYRSGLIAVPPGYGI